MNEPGPQLPFLFVEVAAERSPLRVADTLAAKARERQERDAIAAGLPDWPERTRGLPNSVIRSALFGLTQKEAVKKHEVVLASVDGISVTLVRGKSLLQHHMDVWEHCLRLAREQGTGKRILFSAHSFLGAIERSKGKSDHEWLRQVFYDLAACLVRITDGRYSYFGTLIQGGSRDEATGQYFIEVNQKLALLYGHGQWTQINAEQRKALGKHPLAQWLHAFYSSHREPYRYKVLTIKGLCASEAGELYKFRQLLRKALARLSTMTGWHCEIDGNDCVVIVKK